MTRPFALKNGAYFILTEAPGGIYNAEQLRTIASLCEQESAIVKATEDQRIGMFVSPATMDDITTALQKVGLAVRHYQNGLHGAVACLGEVCPKEEQDALGLAMELQDSFNELDGKSASSCVKVGINGCGSCCVPSHTLDLAITGEDNGYRISLGGKSSQLPELASYAAEGIPPDQVASMVRELIKVYHANKEGEESFGEHIERAGVTAYLEVLKPYSADAHGEDMPFDLSSNISSISPKNSGGDDLSSSSKELDIEAFMEEAPGDAESPINGDENSESTSESDVHDELNSSTSEGYELSEMNMLDDDLIDNPPIIAAKGKPDQKLIDLGGINDLKNDSFMEEILIDHVSEDVNEDILLEEESFHEDISETNPSLDSINEGDGGETLDDSLGLDSISEEDGAEPPDEPLSLASISEEDGTEAPNESLSLDSISEEYGTEAPDESLSLDSITEGENAEILEDSPRHDAVSDVDDYEKTEESAGISAIDAIDGADTSDDGSHLVSINDMESSENINQESEDDLQELELTDYVEATLKSEDDLSASMSADNINEGENLMSQNLEEAAPKEDTGFQNTSAVSDEDSLTKSDEEGEEGDIFENKFNDEITIVAQIPHNDDAANSERESALKNLEDSISDVGSEDDEAPSKSDNFASDQPTILDPGSPVHHLSHNNQSEMNIQGKKNQVKIDGQLTGCQRRTDGLIEINFSGGIHYKFDPSRLNSYETQKIIINNNPLILRCEDENIEITYAAHTFSFERFPYQEGESAA